MGTNHIEEQDSIMVSVVITAYNHEKYIKQAVESVLMQKTNFQYELLVGDDASTDRTQDILRDNFSNIKNVHLVLRKENSNGRNGYWLLNRAKGKYIMNFDGDDYWIGDDVLQTFVDFLEKNPQYVGVSGRRYVFSERKHTRNVNLEKRICNREMSLEDFLNGNRVDYCTTVYRNMFHDGKYDYRLHKYSRDIGDLTLCILILLHGNIYITDKIVGVYRTDRIEKDSSYTSRRTQAQIYKDLMNLLHNLEKHLSVRLDYTNKIIIYTNNYLNSQNGILRKLFAVGNVVKYMGFKMFCRNIKRLDIFGRAEGK
jgi:glycosyltransferase involved in cell wall biosynthesis